MPNKYPSPKSDFIKTKSWVEGHNNLIESPVFNRAIEIAKAEYLRKLYEHGSVEPHTSMMHHQRAMGVEEFLKTLYNLAEPPALPPKMGDQDNLVPPPSRIRRP